MAAAGRTIKSRRFISFKLYHLGPQALSEPRPQGSRSWPIRFAERVHPTGAEAGASGRHCSGYG